ncbi:phosphoribosylformyl-glycineamide synthetase [Pluralibacter gergoviae]|nr:phosphoribosylformyl-glycineamide synthetase [Pluralibacter gergoviae]
MLLNNAPVRNLFVRFVTPIDKRSWQLYFDANGYVAARDAL